MLYKTNEVVAMAIVYEGHLPLGYTLDNRELALEILATAHQSGLSSEIKISPHTVIRAKRVNENAYNAGSYEPTDDFPQMLKECFVEVKEKIISNGETPGPMTMKSMQFKSRSSITSTVWVDIHIKASNKDCKYWS